MLQKQLLTGACRFHLWNDDHVIDQGVLQHLGMDARANARDMALAWLASEADRALGIHGDDLDGRESLLKPARDACDGARRAHPDEDEVQVIKRGADFTPGEVV